jgi:hypothetical protein
MREDMRAERLDRTGNVAVSPVGDAGAGPSLARLHSRAAFLRLWPWEVIVALNQGACERGFTRHALNDATFDAVRQRWEQLRAVEQTLVEALDFLCECHRQEPFVFFSGPTFAEVARRLVERCLADLPLDRRREAVFLAGELVEGNRDRDTVLGTLGELCEVVAFQVGDRVRTLKGTRHGVIRKVLPDGRLVWRPDGGGAELIALPESLLPEAPASA